MLLIIFVHNLIVRNEIIAANSRYLLQLFVCRYFLSFLKYIFVVFQVASSGKKNMFPLNGQ
jgi:hypothetical protein